MSGVEPHKRTLDSYLNYGVVAINKPCGPSSHQVTGWVRNIVGLKKAGHFGTLDPEVSGVLPIALGNATKLARYFMREDKEYVCIMRFHKDISESELKKLFSAFIGKIKQIPPIRSAVSRREREREIYNIEFIEMEGRDVLFKISCEAGTYIRKLCYDLGKKAGIGAHMLELRRIRAGPFFEKNSFLLQELSDAVWLAHERNDESEIRKIILPIEDVLPFKKVWIYDSAVDAICNGAQLKKPGIVRNEEFKKGEKIAIMTLKNELVAVAEAILDSEELKKIEKGQVCKTERVVMQSGVYPRLWGEKKGI